MYIKKLTTKFGSFVYPECKTLFDPFNEEEQLEKMIPNYRNYANNLVNKKSTSNSDLTYKIVKTADNHLSIFKKNDKNVQPPESVDEKAQHVERKHVKNSTIDAVDDLKYQVMKRDNETSRVDGRVDSVILKRKAESPTPIVENRKKIRLLTNNRRLSTPNVKEVSNTGSSKNVIEKVSNDRQTTNTKTNADEQLPKVDKIERKFSKSRETPSKDVTSKEDLISAVVKKLDKLQAFVSTNDNCKVKTLDAISNKMPEISIESVASNTAVDKHVTVIKQRNEPSNSQQVITTTPEKSKIDEDENLLVPMRDRSTDDRSTHEMNDSKKELQMSAITSSRQGSMSGSSIQSISGSLEDPFEMSIKSEPLSGDERDSSMPNDADSERIMSPLDNRSQNGFQESNFSKISVKNIHTMTRPLDQLQRPHVAIRKLPSNKSSKKLLLIVKF